MLEGHVSIEIQQMKEAAAKVESIFNSNLRKGIKKIGEVIFKNRPLFGKAFLELLPSQMPTSFWLACESAFAGVIDERVIFQDEEKAKVLKTLNVKEQRSIMDNGIIVNGRHVKVDDVSAATLSQVLGIGTPMSSGRVTINRKPSHEVKNGILHVNRSLSFTKGELKAILEEME